MIVVFVQVQFVVGIQVVVDVQVVGQFGVEVEVGECQFVLVDFDIDVYFYFQWLLFGLFGVDDYCVVGDFDCGWW